jgi:hypothetical protein
MDIGRVLARSLEIGWRYKVLWVLGFVMALTGGGGNGFNYNFNRSDLNNPLLFPGRPLTFPQSQTPLVITIVGVATCLAIFFLVLFFYFRFVARGALVTFVRSVENAGTPTLGSSWREGQRYYARLLGLGFLFWVPLAIFTILVLLIALLPFIGTAIALFNRISRGEQPPSDFAPIISGVLAFVGLLCCSILCLVIVHLIIHPIYELAVRGIVLEETGTFDGLARAYRRLRVNLGPVALLYLVLLAARIGWSLILTVVAIPFALVLLALINAGASTLPVWAIILLALAMALPFALVFVFLGGLFQVFESNAWTECYLALLAPPSSPPPIVESPAPVATS